MPLVVRAADSRDVEAIVALVNRAYARYVPRMDRAPAPMLADYPSLVTNGSVAVCESVDSVAGSGGQVVGVVVGWAHGDSFYVDNVAVEPGAQGTGIGRALLDEADRLGSLHGCNRLWLYTNVVMVENLDYYRRLGFTEYDRRSEHGYERVFFERPITRSQ